MNKEEALDDFLQGLRIVFNNASAYPKDHPYFIKSVEEFRRRLTTAFSFLNPIKIIITHNSLFIEGKELHKKSIYVDLAELFHYRKIKSIEIRDGVIISELVNFFSNLAMPRRDFLRKGGLMAVLDNKSSPHIIAEPLDYSQLLQEGEVEPDVCVYLLKEAVEKEDSSKIEEIAGKFGKIINKLKLDDLIGDSELRENIRKFLVYLKGNNKNKFKKCMRDIFELLLRHKNALNKEKISGLKIFFDDLDEEGFIDLLSEEILANEGFDVLGFELLSQLSRSNKEDKVAVAFSKKILQELNPENKTRLVQKIKELVSGAEKQSVSKIYQNTLQALLKNISFGKELYFDRESIHDNYRHIIISLLVTEKDKDKLELIVQRLNSELELAFKKNDFNYIKYLSASLREYSGNISDPALIYCEGVRFKIFQFVENIIWKERFHAELNDLIDEIDKSSLSAEIYLSKIFDEKMVNLYSVKLFLRLFPDKIDNFSRMLKEKTKDMEFVIKTTQILGEIDSFLSMKIMKELFDAANEFIKIKILKNMQNISNPDYGFLVSIAKKENAALKKEALVILRKDPHMLKEAAALMLNMPTPFGIKREKIIENMRIIDELDLKDAADYLISLKKRRFFWNRAIRRKAADILCKWNVK